MRTCERICKECPFVNNSLRGWLGPHSIDEMLIHFQFDVPFSCHMTRKHDSKPEDIENGKLPVCRGFIAACNKSAKLFRRSELLALQHKVKAEQIENESEVMTTWEFVQYHSFPFEEEDNKRP